MRKSTVGKLGKETVPGLKEKVFFFLMCIMKFKHVIRGEDVEKLQKPTEIYGASWTWRKRRMRDGRDRVEEQRRGGNATMFLLPNSPHGMNYMSVAK